MTKTGACGVGRQAVVARAAPHYGEEPCISGTRGSGAVFFSGCALGCVFCQNSEISRGGAGKTLTAAELRDVFLRLRDSGVHNLNLVTGSHFTPVIAEALAGVRLGIPVVWNSSGYESVETLRQLEGLVQVWLPDFKYALPEPAARYSSAPDYPQVALAAIREMYRQSGPAQQDSDGLLCRGVLVRHLVLPGNAENTLRVIDAVEDNFPRDAVMFSLMAQYTPMPAAARFPELRRRVTEEEYNRCLSYLDFSTINRGYVQSLDAATTDQIPAFDGTGV
ncbi:MAG: radical SAM protein [Oscillospiraceae bacterium]|nr:radical SAM protein [Oscillospiraceae bacterium]